MNVLSFSSSSIRAAGGITQPVTTDARASAWVKTEDMHESFDIVIPAEIIRIDRRGDGCVGAHDMRDVYQIFEMSTKRVDHTTEPMLAGVWVTGNQPTFCPGTIAFITSASATFMLGLAIHSRWILNWVHPSGVRPLSTSISSTIFRRCS